MKQAWLQGRALAYSSTVQCVSATTCKASYTLYILIFCVAAPTASCFSLTHAGWGLWCFQLPFHSLGITVADLKCALWLCLRLTGSCLAQYMEGGDLHKALARDVKETGAGASRRLSWYGRGHRVLLDIASGLTYLHSKQVRVRRK